jgi:hypothetical protein
MDLMQSELDCRFTFDFSQVYWNSRLSAEHERLVDLFAPDELVADVFAGVGPFALPAAKKGTAVLANDLNPNSYKYLQVNIDDNKASRFALSWLGRADGAWASRCRSSCAPRARTAAISSAGWSGRRSTGPFHPTGRA